MMLKLTGSRRKITIFLVETAIARLLWETSCMFLVELSGMIRLEKCLSPMKRLYTITVSAFIRWFALSHYSIEKILICSSCCTVSVSIYSSMLDTLFLRIFTLTSLADSPFKSSIGTSAMLDRFETVKKIINYYY